jgi:outer membrane protein insertion porin family
VSPIRGFLAHILRVVLATAVVVLLLAGLGLFPQEPLRRLAEDALRSRVGTGSRLGGLHVTPLLLRADLRDLRLEGPGFALRVPACRVALSPRAILERAPVLRRVELDAPDIDLRPAGQEASSAQGAAGEPPLLGIDRLRVTGGRLTWRDTQAGSLVLEDLSAHGSVGWGTLDLDAPAIRWRGRADAPTATARARLGITRRLDVTLLSLSGRVGSSQVSAHGPLLRRAAFAPDLQMEATVDPADLGRFVAPGELSGALSLDGRLEGRRATLRVRGTTRFREWEASGVDVRVAADTGGESLNVGAEVRLLGGRLTGQATLDGGVTRGEVAVTGIDLARLPASARGPLRAGTLDARATWEGPLEGPVRADLVAKGRASTDTVAGRSEAEAHGTVRLSERSLDLAWSAHGSGEASATTLTGEARGLIEGAWPPAVSGTLSGVAAARTGERTVEAPVTGRFSMHSGVPQARLEVHGPLEATAEIDVRKGHVETGSLKAVVADLSSVAEDARGSFTLEAHVSGPVLDPAIILRASGKAVAWREVTIGAVEAHVQGDAGRADVQVSLPDLSIRSDGALFLKGARRFEGQTELQGTSLGSVGALLGLGESLTGQLTATVRHDVPFERPLDGRVSVQVAALSFEREGRRLEAGPFRAEVADGRVRIEDLEIHGPGLSLGARAEAGLGPDDAFDLHALLQADLALLPLPQEWALRGSVTGVVGLGGTRRRPAPSGSIRGTDVSVRMVSLPPLSLDAVEVVLNEDGLRVLPTSARLGEGRVELEGEVPYPAVWPALRKGGLRPSERARISVHAEDLPVPGLEGGVGGTLTVEGGLTSLREPHAVLALSESRLGIAALSVTLRPATLVLDDGRVTTEGVRLRSEGGDFVLTGAADLASGNLDVEGKGALALALLSPLLQDAAVDGTADLDLAVAGPFATPTSRGSVRLDGVSLRLRAVPQAVTDVSGRVALAGASATVDLTGRLGGGELRLSGDAGFAGTTLDRLHLALDGQSVALRYPPGLRSRLGLGLELEGQAGTYTLKGDVEVQGGVYEIETAVREALRAPASPSAESPLLAAIGLDVAVKLARPVVVRSTFGRLEATGRITARGDLNEPLPYGRLSVRRGGRVEVQGREFAVTDGSLTYSGDWNAALSLTAEAVIHGIDQGVDLGTDYRVRATLGGTLDEPSLTLSSDPGLSRQEIVSLIATGQLRSSNVDASAWLLGGQAAALLSGGITRRVAQSFGLDEITVRPDLVAKETDPSARFTFGKRLGRRLGLIYSAGLGGPETRFVELQARPGRDVTLRAQRTDDGSVALGAGQRFEWGDQSPAGRSDQARVRLRAVRFEGEPISDELRRSVRLKAGARVTDWRVQSEAERLRSRLRRKGHLEAEVSGRIEGGTAVLTVYPGPVFATTVRGMADPPALDGILHQALFEADALDLGRERLLGVLNTRGYLRAGVTTSAADEGARRLLVFAVTPGERYDRVEVRFPGATSLDEATLLRAAGGAAGLLERPDAAGRAVLDLYRQRSFLAAHVASPRVETSGHLLRIVVQVEEGPRGRLVALRFEGTTLPETDLRKAASVVTGVPYDPDAAQAAIRRVRELYLTRGYADVRVRPELVREGDDLALTLAVSEGERQVIRELHLVGNSRTRSSLVERATGLEVGDPVNPRRLAEAERRLLAMGTFSRAAIVPEAGDPSILRVELREAANLTAAYDLRWDDSAGTSVLVDSEVANLLGLGLAVGGRIRFGGDRREQRGTLHAPAVLVAGDLTGSVYRTEQDFVAAGSTITEVQKGLQLQHSLRPGGRWEVLTGYRFRRNLTVAESLPAIPIDIGGLDLSVLHTTWDDLLDPTGGHFLSTNLEVAPSFLGSDAPLLKTYTQLALARSFDHDALTWGHSYRLGLAWGLDGEPVISGERFRAGGASSLRGFGTNEVGPRGPLGDPAGGQAVVIVNEELRYRHPSGLGAALFYDVGNVFRRVQDLSFDLRHTIGAGLRWASPVGLLRVDVGLPLDRLPEEKRYRIFFGLGQAF